MELETVTKEQALAKWTHAATVDSENTQIDNWRPLAHALRHFSSTDSIEATEQGVITASRSIGTGDKASKYHLRLAVK